MDFRDVSIISQVSFKATVENFGTTPIGMDNIVSFVETFELLSDALFNEISRQAQDKVAVTPTSRPAAVDTTPSNVVPFNAASALAEAFPGSKAAGELEVRLPQGAASNGPLPSWLPEKCAELGITAVWDNRAEATAANRRPQFKQVVQRGEKAYAFWADGSAKLG